MKSNPLFRSNSSDHPLNYWTKPQVQAWITETVGIDVKRYWDVLGFLDGRGLLDLTREELDEAEGMPLAQKKALLRAVEDLKHQYEDPSNTHPPSEQRSSPTVPDPAESPLVSATSSLDEEADSDEEMNTPVPATHEDSLDVSRLSLSPCKPPTPTLLLPSKAAQYIVSHALNGDRRDEEEEEERETEVPIAPTAFPPSDLLPPTGRGGAKRRANGKGGRGSNTGGAEAGSGAVEDGTHQEKEEYKDAHDGSGPLPSRPPPPPLPSFNPLLEFPPPAQAYEFQAPPPTSRKEKGVSFAPQAAGPDPEAMSQLLQISALEKRSLSSFSSGEFSEAIQQFEKCLAIRLKALGPDHPAVATTYANIGNCYKSMKKYERALKKFDLCLSIRIKSLGAEHLNTAAAHLSVGSCLKYLERYGEALTHYESCLKIRLKHLGPDHPDTIKPLRTINRLKRRIDRRTREKKSARGKKGERKKGEGKASFVEKWTQFWGRFRIGFGRAKTVDNVEG